MNRIRMSAAMIAITLCFVAGCGKERPQGKPEDTVFGPTIKAKDRVVDETQKAMEANKQKLEEAMKKNDEAQKE